MERIPRRAAVRRPQRFFVNCPDGPFEPARITGEVRSSSHLDGLGVNQELAIESLASGDGAQETAMLKFDHLTIPVSNWAASRDWYVKSLGLRIEFEVPERCTVALQDQFDFTIFLVQDPITSHAARLSLTFQVDDVQKSFEQMSRKGLHFTHPPQKVFWGYGAELRDPDGYSVRLWDEKSIKAKG